MSRLRLVSSQRFEDLLSAAPGALEADAAMRGLLLDQLPPRLYSLIALVVAGCLRCGRFADALRGSLDQPSAQQAARDWRALDLSAAEKAILAYAEKGTLDEASVRSRDVDELRDAGFDDRDVLLIAAAIAYHNYSLRMAVTFDVVPR